MGSEPNVEGQSKIKGDLPNYFKNNLYTTVGFEYLKFILKHVQILLEIKLFSKTKYFS